MRTDMRDPKLDGMLHRESLHESVGCTEMHGI
jgi:hypothetical protein